jgi:hypothetical protein
MRLRRTLITLCLTGAFLPMLTITNEAAAGPNGPCSGSPYYVTKRTPPLIREAKVKRLIRCVFIYLGIPGEVDTAFYVVNRESHFTPWAKNPWTDSACHPFGSNPYGSCGTAQHLARYWPGRVRSYLPARFFPRWPYASVLAARPNVWAMGAMVRGGGWSPWSL